MEIRNLQPQGPERSRSERAVDAIDLTRSNRERIAESSHVFEERQLEAIRQPASERLARASGAPREDQGRADRLELSAAARALAEDEDTAQALERRERIEALRAEREAGGLETPARVERAAEKLLGA